MRIIYKYPVAIGANEIKLPKRSTALAVQVQRDELFMWASIDPEQKEHGTLYVNVIGTGHPYDERTVGDHWCTVQQGPFVWHVFARSSMGAFAVHPRDKQ